MKINIKKSLELFDERRPKYRGHTSSIISMLGEDLAAAAFKSYMTSVVGCEERKFQAEDFSKGAGPQLDRWFYNKQKNILYQCEIKNWCAWATKSWELKVDAKPEEIRKVSNNYWEGPIKTEFRGKGKDGKISKVLVKMKMKPPNKKYLNTNIEPLLIFWWPVSTEQNLSPYFSVNVADLKVGFKPKFKQLHIFSVSLYLRKLHKKGVKWLKISDPDIKQRLAILKKLLS